MKLKTDTFYIQNNKSDLYYASLAYHRNNTRKSEKSQWRISIKEEFQVFNDCFINFSWFDNHIGWGIYLDPETKSNMLQIGISTIKNPLHFIKYVDGGKDNMWHGYPADYLRKIQDKPSSIFLNEIYSRGFISKPQYSKIKKGKKCNL